MRRLAYGFLVLVVLGSLMAGGFVRVSRTESRPPSTRPPDMGFTFSQRQAGYLDLSWQQAFQAAMDLDPNLVRLGAYWDDIEPSPGQFDFSTLDWLLDNTPSQSSVLLTVGMKAPRWPEYFLPKWLQREVKVPSGGDIASDPQVRQATLDYIRAVVEHVKDRPNLKYWQVENEPLDPSGPRRWTIDAGFLAQEVALVRSLDPARPIVGNIFVDASPLTALPSQRDALESRARTILGMVDVLGLDLYTVRPTVVGSLRLSFSWPAWIWEPRVLDLRDIAQGAGKQIWISEAQAEPWLPARLVDNSASSNGKASPALTSNTVERLQADGFNTILFWGVEYWYMRDTRYQDNAWWSHMLRFFTKPAIQQEPSPDA